MTFWPKSLVFKEIKQMRVIFWSTKLVLKLIEVNFGLKSSFKYLIFGLESSFKYCCDNHKWLLIKSFEHFNQIKQAGCVGHADCVDRFNNVLTATIVSGVDMGMSTGFTLVSSMATVSTTLTNPVTKFHL